MVLNVTFSFFFLYFYIILNSCLLAYSLECEKYDKVKSNFAGPFVRSGGYFVGFYILCSSSAPQTFIREENAVWLLHTTLSDFKY